VKEGRLPALTATLAQERRASATLADYVELAKPRLNLLVVVTSAVGFYLGSNGAIDAWSMVNVSIGTALVAAGAAALNQVYERDTDALMNRTRLRPLPAGRVAPTDASVFGVALAVLGVSLLAVETNLTASLIALATLAIYLAVYTPLKRRTPVATLIGAVPGALPPLIGWTGAHGTASLAGWTLFAIVFLWQIPHFMAIAWMYRDDYSRARFPMLPVIEPDGRRTGRQAALYAAALLPASLAPSFLGLSGSAYLIVAAVLGAALLFLSVRFALRRSDASARALFFGSITYLPLLWAALMLDH
jgi:protoheme IX farnesyltransferase